MEAPLIIRPARRSDSGEIVALIGESFSPELLSSMIYGCSGIKRYVDVQIGLPDGMSDTLYTVAENAGRIVGCVELRWLPEALFLNYICTRSDARCTGMGRSLLRESILLARHNVSEMHLDVFENNDTARTWYERLGFHHVSRTQWWEFPLPIAGVTTCGRVSGYPHAEAGFDAFGFSQFRLQTSRGDYSIGMMGRDRFRVTQPGILDDLEALAALTRMDTSRRLLALLPADSITDSSSRGGRHLVTTCRMTAELDLLMAKLSG